MVKSVEGLQERREQKVLQVWKGSLWVQKNRGGGTRGTKNREVDESRFCRKGQVLVRVLFNVIGINSIGEK